MDYNWDFFGKHKFPCILMQLQSCISNLFLENQNSILGEFLKLIFMVLLNNSLKNIDDENF